MSGSPPGTPRLARLAAADRGQSGALRLARRPSSTHEVPKGERRKDTNERVHCAEECGAENDRWIGGTDDDRPAHAHEWDGPPTEPDAQDETRENRGRNHDNQSGISRPPCPTRSGSSVLGSISRGRLARQGRSFTDALPGVPCLHQGETEQRKRRTPCRDSRTDLDAWATRTSVGMLNKQNERCDSAREPGSSNDPTERHDCPVRTVSRSHSGERQTDSDQQRTCEERPVTGDDLVWSELRADALILEDALSWKASTDAVSGEIPT